MLHRQAAWLGCGFSLLIACQSSTAADSTDSGAVDTTSASGTGVTGSGGAGAASGSLGSATTGSGGGAGEGLGTASSTGGARNEPVLCTPSLGRATWAVRFADMVVTRWSSPRAIMGELGLFQYNSGIVLRGLLEVYRKTCDDRYAEYIKRYVDAAENVQGHLDIPEEHNFDTLQPAVLLPFLYEYTGDERYRTWAREVLDRYDSIPRNADGGYWHKQNYPNELWCDTIYVGMTPLLEYARVFDDCGDLCRDEPVTQALLLAEHVQLASGLMLHAYDADANAIWADVSGASPEVWGRGLGWYLMATVEILSQLPETHTRRPELLLVLTKIADGLRATQDASGLWYQVVDQGGEPQNFLETSSTGMFVYALDLAVERGYLAADFSEVVSRGWQGLLDQGRLALVAGAPQVSGAVEGMGVQLDYQAYVGKQTLVDSSHGLVAALLAAARMAE